MQEKMISFREFLQARLHPLTQNLAHSMPNIDLLSEVVLLLANYQEEGTNLFPVIFITDAQENLKKHLLAKEMIYIGEGPSSRETFARAFKHCAPLAEDRLWAVYILSEKDRIRYGIFRSDSSPLVPTVFERLRSMKEPAGTCIIGITRLGGNFVEIHESSGLQHYVNVSGTDEDDYHPGRVIRNFVDGVTRDAPDSIKAMLKSFYYRVGMDVMHGSHGSLIGVLAKGQSIPDILEDGIHLRPSINVSEAILAILENTDERDAYLRLYSYSLLLRKLTWMDGITLLDTEGGILGYNCFIKTSHVRPQDAITGGARRRAFEHMQKNVGGLLSGALYKSQDGHIEFKGKV